MMYDIDCCFSVVSEDASESVTHSARDLLYCLVQQLMADTTALPQEAFRLTKLKTNCVSLTTSGQVKNNNNNNIFYFNKKTLNLTIGMFLIY